MLRFAKKLVAKRFGKDKEEKQDMLGSFVKHGLTQREAETEATFQMSAHRILNFKFSLLILPQYGWV